ncbi:diguanylate cyclase [Shewanella waksmanii]|uniref:tetratricopeptide repeat-containing diguanylate cyclase n=1 Tax=Shewanella waksmanii TaxID=213783 RepID=UPI0037359CE6
MGLVLLIWSNWVKAEFDPVSELRALPHGEAFLANYRLADIDPAKARAQLESWQAAGVTDKETLYQVVHFRTMHNVYTAQSALELSEQQADELVALGESLGKQWIQAEGWLLKAILAAKRGDIELAWQTTEQVIVAAEAKQFNRLLARALNVRAILHSRKQQFKRAIGDYQRALALISVYPGDPYISKIISNMSTIYAELENWQEASKYNQRALELYRQEQIPNHGQLSILYTNSALYAGKLGDFDKEIKHIRLASVEAELSGDPLRLLDSMSNEVELLVRQSQYQAAVTLAQQCIALAKQHQYTFNLGGCSMSLGQAFLALGQYQQAEQFAADAIAAYGDGQAKLYQVKVSRLLSDIHLAQGRYPEAIAALTYYFEETQKILVDERQQKVVELQAQFDQKVKEDKIALLAAENALQAAKLERKALREWFSLTISVILISTVIYLIRRYNSSIKRNRSLRESNQALYEHSYRDPLTELYNRRYFYDHLASRLNESNREHYSLIMLDLDHFKAINDTYGHDSGDGVLQIAAERFSGCIREQDFIVRWGGEEFLLMLAVDDMEPLVEVLKRLNQVIADETFMVLERQLNVSVSIGATPPMATQSMIANWQQMQSQADQALYQAKQQGRNRFAIFNPDA